MQYAYYTQRSRNNRHRNEIWQAGCCLSQIKKYGEHVDNHQLEIAESFSELNYVLLCKEEDDLEDILKKCSTHKFDKFISKREKMITTITEYLKTV